MPATDQEFANAHPLKGVSPNLEQIRKAAELLHIRRFSGYGTKLGTAGISGVGRREMMHGPEVKDASAVSETTATERDHCNEQQVAIASQSPVFCDAPSGHTRSGITPAPSGTLSVTTMLEKFRVEGVLGADTFGITYLAFDTHRLSQLAIKEYFPTELCHRGSSCEVCIRCDDYRVAFKEGLEAFVDECRTLATLRHPGVVRMLQHFYANNTAYAVLDHQSGENLTLWVRRRGALGDAQLLKMFLPLLDGLEIVHGAGLLHRNINPASLMVREDESLVLTDFAAVRHALGSHGRNIGTIVTPGFTPFEQYHSHGRQGPWTDIYAIGGVLYWLVTGGQPVEAPARIKADALVPAQQAGRGRSHPSILAAVDWALEMDEKKRPRSIAEFKAALQSPAPIHRTAHTDTVALSDSAGREFHNPAGSFTHTAWWKPG